MDAQATGEILRFFRGLNDPRAANARHRLEDILSIAILAVLCGSEGWAAVESWGWGNLQWLGAFLALPHGIPSHDTFDRVFGLLDPLGFEKQFRAFTQALIKNGAGVFVRVDGKTLRRSWKKAWSKTPVHRVSALAQKNQVVLGQVATDCKSKRDHGHSQAAGHADADGADGDDRRDGLPAGDRPADHPAERALHPGGQGESAHAASEGQGVAG